MDDGSLPSRFIRCNHAYFDSTASVSWSWGIRLREVAIYARSGRFIDGEPKVDSVHQDSYTVAQADAHHWPM